MIDHLELFKEVLTGGVYEESAWYDVRSVVAPPTGVGRRLKDWILTSLAERLDRSGLALLRRQSYRPDVRQNGEDWPLVGYTMIGRRRLDSLQKCVETILRENLPGDLAETGVWRGGACMLMKALLNLHGDRGRSIWLADSFAGMPVPRDSGDGLNLSRIRYLAVGAEQVRRNFERFGLWDDRVKLLEGWFRDTLPTAPIERLALLRLDGDLYHSTMDVLSNLYDRVVPGGFVIVDDYGSWASCRRAVREFLQARHENPVMEKIDATGVWWRTPSE